MFVLRSLCIMIACIFAGNTFAQNLLPTPISTAPFYFNATPMMPPSIMQPYQLPNYWQQPSMMSNIMPAFSQLTSMLGDELSSKGSGSLYGEDYGRDSGNYTTSSDFLYDRDRSSRRRSYTRSRSSRASSTSENKPTRTVTATSTPAPTDQCEECNANKNNSPPVLEAQTSQVARTAAAVSNVVLDDTLLAYQNSEQVKKMIASVRSGALKARNQRRVIVGSKAASESLGRCLMYVKFAMLDADFFSNYPSGTYASNFAPALENQGFVNLMNGNGYEISEPKDAPIGSIIVYENTPGTKTPGHIEIKLSDSDYGSDYIDDQPRSDTSNNRKIIGIYAKIPAGDS